MTRTRMFVVSSAIGLVVSAAWLAGIAIRSGHAQQAPADASKAAGHAHKPGAAQHDHDHPPIPAAYANAHIPTHSGQTQDSRQGKEIFTAKSRSHVEGTAGPSR